MRLLTRALACSLLVLSPVSCKTTGDQHTAGPSAGPRVKRTPGMPRPLRLPASPQAAMHVENPKQVLHQLAAYAPGQQKPRALLRQALGQSHAGFEMQLVDHVNLGKPWSSAIVEGQTIMHVPIKADSVAAVNQMLAQRPKEGSFGAVRLQRAAEDKGPKLAYLDRQAMTLTLADDLRGIATGPALRGAYGKQKLFVTINAKQASKYGFELPAQTMEIRGSGIDDFKLDATGVRQDYPELDRMANGALTGMLESPKIALGFSTKYASYKTDVDKIIGDASREISKQNFLVRGNLEELLKRAKASMRAWNGRTMVGVGPAHHVLLGLGSDDSNFGTKVLYFISGLMSNLQTAKTFGVPVPRVRFARSKDNAAGSNIHVIALESARKYVPEQYHSLIDQRGDLRVAFSFPTQRLGGAMVVAGPDCQNVIKAWMSDTANATPGAKTRDHFAAATIAVPPPAVQKVMADNSGTTALNLSASTKPTRVVLKRNEDKVNLKVKS
jgi:hypothetical protein